MSAVEVENLTVSYGASVAVDGVSFTLDAGRLVGIVGPNGAGKTTMIKAMIGVLPRASGEVRVHGATGKKALEETVYVPQRASIDWDFPLTVRDVVTQGLYRELGLLRRVGAAERQRVDQALESVSLADLQHRQIGELSGGQQQRVFLARALAQRGRLFLMDEPLQGVDAITEEAIITVLRSLRDGGATVAVVHHDLSTVPTYFDDVLLINRELIAVGPTAEVFTPGQLQRAYGGRLATFGDTVVA